MLRGFRCGRVARPVSRRRSGQTLGNPGIAVKLVTPTEDHIESYEAALVRGWSADNVRCKVAAAEELERLRSDPRSFLESMVDREAHGGPVTLPDGSTVPRLPGYRRWLWDGEFCGSIGFRWQRGTTALPPHCLGHIGYAVVPWKQRQGYATLALRLFLRGGQRRVFVTHRQRRRLPAVPDRRQPHCHRTLAFAIAGRHAG